MNAARKLLVSAVLVGALAAPATAAAATPAWSIQSLAAPTNFAPGDAGEIRQQPRYKVFITNSGGATTDQSPITITDTLPAGLVVKSFGLGPPRGGSLISACGTSTDPITEVVTVSCKVTETVPPEMEPARLSPGDAMELGITVAVPATVTGALVNRVEVKGGGAEPAAAEAENRASAEDAKAAFEEFHSELTDADGQPATAADSHPYQLTTSFGVNLVPTPPGSNATFVPAEGDLKDVEVALPPGLAANPTATERCSAQQFTTHHSIFSPLAKKEVGLNECPLGSVVGVALVEMVEGETFFNRLPIYNLIPPKGMPAQLGFEVVNGPNYINTRIRSDGDYGVSGFLANVTEAKRISAARIMIWGTPGDESHDRLRGVCTASHEACPLPAGTPRPFLRLPSRCGNPLETTMSFTTWAQPATGASDTSVGQTLSDCAAPDFSPTIEARPSSDVADSPSGLHFGLHLPEREHEEDPAGLGEADLRDVSVALPAGLVVNPASADGRQACTPAQIGLSTLPGQSPVHFTTAPAQCPDAAKVGSVEADVPAVDHPLTGSVYLAQQEDNPFDSLLALYIVLEDEQTGIVVKLAAKVSPDPLTGQLTTTVSDSPQVPVEDFKFDFFEGPRAPLRTPSTCGNFATATSLTPWTAPESGPAATPSSSFVVASAPGGGACPTTPAAEPNAPGFEAGTAASTAGAYSPLVVHLNRPDGSQEFGSVSVTLPPGATGKLAGIPECSDAQIAVAQARSHPGEGALEQASPSCPAASAIGTVTVGAGAGPSPFYVTGQAYLGGPYKGAPFSAVFITPAIAGPFDLGVVVVRAGLYINPVTAQVTTKSDPLPSILQGIPLDIRSVTVNVDRPGFTLNPTNCSPLAVTGQEISTQGQVAPLSGRFQVGGCASLKFAPKFAVSTSGKTSKAGGASLVAKLTYPAPFNGYANIAKVKVELPKQLPSRLTTLQKACVAAQFEADPAGCPSASVVGHATATTPILPVPLEGPAIFVSHGNEAFPSLTMVLQGDNVTIDLVGTTFISKTGVTSTTFKTVPDAPVGSFTLTLPQGKFSALAANGDLCKSKLAMPTEFVAQNGAEIKQSTPISLTGCSSSISVVSHTLKGRNLTVSVSVPAAGKLKASGKGLSKAAKTSKGRETIKLTLHATKRGKFSTRVKLTFTPTKGKSQPRSLKPQSAAVKVKFKK